MREALYLLPGWGLAPELLQPLAEALQPRWDVTLLALPEQGSAELCLDALDRQIPAHAWLAGWSLGGMLAMALAARRGAACLGVITLAANACFVARDGWPEAMPLATFDAFLAGCEADSGATLKRFALLCAQGSGQARGLARQLQAAPGALSPALLRVLGELDNRQALEAFDGPQLHLFAEQDGLVPQAAAGLVPCSQVLAGACHAFPVESPGLVAQAMLALRERADA